MNCYGCKKRLLRKHKIGWGTLDDSAYDYEERPQFFHLSCWPDVLTLCELMGIDTTGWTQPEAYDPPQDLVWQLYDQHLKAARLARRKARRSA